MELNKNSVTSKIYRWFYNKISNEMPNNLCPYFWQLVFMWIVFIPSVILSLPYSILIKLQDGRLEHHPGLGIIGWGILYFIKCLLISFGWLFFEYEEGGYLINHAIMGIIISFILLVMFSPEIDRYFKPKTHTKPKPNIIIEFTKAKYNKYCPKIDWK
jgi:uncharacterized membrane protein (DUF106 family)